MKAECLHTGFMNDTQSFVLSYEHEETAVVFRINGVLLERFDTYTSYGNVMLGVIRAIRRYHPALSEYITASNLWRTMVSADEPILVYTFSQLPGGVVVKCCKDFAGAYSVRVYRCGVEDLKQRRSTEDYFRVRVLFEQMQEALCDSTATNGAS